MGGLQAQIWRNALKSALLLAGFPLVLPVIISAVVYTTLLVSEERDAVAYAGQTFVYAHLLMVAATVVWLPIAYLMSQWIIDKRRAHSRTFKGSAEGNPAYLLTSPPIRMHLAVVSKRA